MHFKCLLVVLLLVVAISDGRPRRRSHRSHQQVKAEQRQQVGAAVAQGKKLETRLGANQAAAAVQQGIQERQQQVAVQQRQQTPTIDDQAQSVCKLVTVCQAVADMEKVLQGQAEQLGAQGKGLEMRLEANEAKLHNVQAIGKQVTDLLTQQGAKIAEQATTLKDSEGKLMEQVTGLGAKLAGRVDARTARIDTLAGKQAKIAEAINGQDAKIQDAQGVAAKAMDQLAAEDKRLTGKLAGQVSRMQVKLPLPDGKMAELEENMAKTAEKLNAHDAKLGAVQTVAAALKEKLGAADVKIGQQAAGNRKAADKLVEGDESITAEGQTVSGLQGALQANDATIAEAAAQNEASVQAVKGAALKTGALAAAQNRRKEKMAGQQAKLNGINDQTKVAEGGMRAQNQRIAAVQADIQGRNARAKGVAVPKITPKMPLPLIGK